MKASDMDLDDVEIDVNELDFSGLEEKYKVNPDSGIEEYVVVDGAPIAPESKIPMLRKVLTKLFANSKAELALGDESFYFPLDGSKTTGFLFVRFKNQQHADLAVKSLNGRRLDTKHRLFVNKLSDIEKYGAEGAVADKPADVKVPEFKQTDYLKSWLQDSYGRDQYILHFGDTVAVKWHKNSSPPETVMERMNFTAGFTLWSPQGSYLLTIHPQGIQSWGGKNFDKIQKFFHPEVRLIAFSPDEKYLVSLSPEPIKLPPEDHPARASFPFGKQDEGNKLIIWELATGIVAKTLKLPPSIEQSKKVDWPLIKWSYDGKYFAREVPKGLAIYESATMSLLDAKEVELNGLQDFEFAPAGIKLAGSKSDELSHVVSFWTPETSNQTARVALLEVPLKKVLRTVNLFQVSECRFHWQDEGKYLCVKVDRHTKSKKTTFSNLEFFNLLEKEIPVEKIELKETVINFAWESKGERFVTISRLDQGPVNLAIPKNNINFYAPEFERKKGEKPAAAAVDLNKFKNFKTIADKHSVNINWSPKGRFVALSNVASASKIDFFDLDYDGNTVLASDEQAKSQNVKANLKQIGDVEYFGLTNVEWDPSGRYLAGWSSSWRHKIDNGYKLFSFAGNLVSAQGIDNFKQLLWRPRPASLLSGSDRKKVRKNLREYSVQFDEQDAMEASEATRELILTRRRLLEEWRTYVKETETKKKSLGIVEEKLDEGNETEIKEIKEEILEEKEEIVE